MLLPSCFSSIKSLCCYCCLFNLIPVCQKIRQVKLQIWLGHNWQTVEWLVKDIFTNWPTLWKPGCFLHYAVHLIRCQAVAVHRKCDAISVSRPHMFIGVPSGSESVSSNVCGQQPVLLSSSGYLGLHKWNTLAVWKQPPVSMRARCCSSYGSSRCLTTEAWANLQRLAPQGGLFCIIIKGTYGVWVTVLLHSCMLDCNSYAVQAFVEFHFFFFFLNCASD